MVLGILSWPGVGQEEYQGELQGVVLSGSGGAPLPGVELTLVAPGSRTGLTLATTTGAAGDFHFRRLPPGSYTIHLKKPGFRLRHGEPRVQVGKNQKLAGLVLRLWPGAILRGRVVHGGEPAAQAEVRAYSIVSRGGRTLIALQASAATGEGGEFRFTGLPAGDYLLDAGPLGGAAAVYYRDAPGPLEATPLRLEWDRELSGIEIRMPRPPAGVLEGRISRNPGGRACARCRIWFGRAEELLSPGSRYVTTSAQGEFRISGLTPDTYTLAVEAQEPPRSLSTHIIHIANEETNSLVVNADSRQSVAGHVVFAEPPPETRANDLSVSLSPVRLADQWPDAHADVVDGAFLVENVSPGRYRVDVRTLPPGAYLRTLRLAGRDLQDPEVTVQADASLTGLEVVVAFDSACIRGRLNRTEDALQPADIVLLPLENESPYLAESLTQANQGAFELCGVAPGGYHLFAIPRGGLLDPRDPETRLALQPYAATIYAQPRENHTVELSLVP